MFGLHLWHYASDKYIQNNPEVMDFLNNKKPFDAYKTSIDNLLHNEKAGIIRDIMVFKFMSSLFDEFFPAFERYYKQGTEKINNPILVSELEKRYKQAKDALNYNLVSIDNLTKKEYEVVGNLYDLLIKESKDKVLYLDFWTTWCGPCRAEIPKLIELQDKIKDKNIEIVSLCCNSDKDTWALFIKKNNIPGKQFRLDKAQVALIRSKLKFQGYPTYMIIKDGLIISKHADRPSSGDKIVNELLRIEAL